MSTPFSLRAKSWAKTGLSTWAEYERRGLTHHVPAIGKAFVLGGPGAAAKQATTRGVGQAYNMWLERCR